MKDITPAINAVVGKAQWLANTLIGILSAGVMLASLLPLVGFKLPFIKPLSFTELAYCMGAICLYGFNKRG